MRFSLPIIVVFYEIPRSEREYGCFNKLKIEEIKRLPVRSPKYLLPLALELL